MPHIPGHLTNNPLGPGGTIDAPTDPFKFKFNPSDIDPQTGLPKGQAFLGNILRERAAQGGPQFQDLLIDPDRFSGNPLALQFLNQGLGERGKQFMDGQVVPQTGLIGSTTTLEGGLDASQQAINDALRKQLEQLEGGKETAIDFLGGGRDLATEAITEGKQAFDPFFQPGVQAGNLQADLSGANGPEAQARAVREFQESPGQEFLRSRGTKAIERAAGRFGDFGPNLFKDLASFEQGLALQDLQRQTGQLGELAQRGFGAAQGLGQLAQTQAGIETDFGRSAAQAELGTASELASATGTGGVNVANLIQNASQLIAAGQFETGKLIAQDIRNTVSTVGGLQEEQGRQLSNLLGAGASAVSEILQTSGLTAAEQQQVMAAILADLATGSATGQAGFSGAIGAAGALGQLGESQAFSDTISRIFTALGAGDGGGTTFSGTSGQLVA